MAEDVTAILDRLDELERRLEGKLNKLAESREADPMEMLDVNAFAVLAGVSVWAVRRWSDVPWSKVGRKLYITRKDAVNYLTANRRETPAEAIRRARQGGAL